MLYNKRIVNKIFTTDEYGGMIIECRDIAAKFIGEVKMQRSKLDPLSNEDDIDAYEVGEKELRELFERFKVIMNLNSELDFFRDNDKEKGKYNERNDVVYLPYCIGFGDEKDMVEVMAHELFHAFQYYAICNPGSYPCFGEKTVMAWGEEFKNYVNGDDDIHQYYGQEIEKSAREFGKMMLQ